MIKLFKTVSVSSYVTQRFIYKAIAECNWEVGEMWGDFVSDCTYY